MSQTEIRFSGSGGQGLNLSASIISATLLMTGKSVAQSQSYEPTSRGGLSRADIVVSDGVSDYPLVTALDYLVILDACAIEVSQGLIRDSAVVLVDELRVPQGPKGKFTLHALPFVATARKLGNERVANIIAIAALARLSGIVPLDLLERAVRARVPGRLLDINLEALEAGYALVPEGTATAA
ncbi:hypothetical protein MNBD_ALPHA09-342 [hydrothermal vent metagenome]|uniref:Pyruvate/ketoisovalerate oxidoreductase catalytic domain-containing protein n=1 Tax=hydrothermal vent metagenome TaxID=652676 RepID=A0A3B0TGN1_9ZZZZ